MALANENVLAGLCCPACGSEGPLRIAVLTTLLVSDDGTEPDPNDGGLEWDETSFCQCVACAYALTVQAFLEGAVLWAETVVCQCCEKDTPSATAHRYQGGYVGENCCWDERLRSSE